MNALIWHFICPKTNNSAKNGTKWYYQQNKYPYHGCHFLDRKILQISRQIFGIKNRKQTKPQLYQKMLSLPLKRKNNNTDQTK